jgi:SNF2 family DNA or RNA helicase
LRRLLRPVVLRRTADALAKALPPRTELVVFCRLSAPQRSRYAALVAATGFGDGRDNDENDDGGSSCAERAAATLAVTYADEGASTSSSSSSSSNSAPKAGATDPLTAIHALRMLCNHPSLLPASAAAANGAAAATNGAATTRYATPASAAAAVVEAPLDVLASGKLRVLQALLAAIYHPEPTSSSSSSSSTSTSSSSSSSSANERVVVVSNFTSTLDLVGRLARSHGWGSLRIDGTTPPDQRQGLVDRFNRPQV